MEISQRRPHQEKNSGDDGEKGRRGGEGGMYQRKAVLTKSANYTKRLSGALTAQCRWHLGPPTPQNRNSPFFASSYRLPARRRRRHVSRNVLSSPPCHQVQGSHTRALLPLLPLPLFAHPSHGRPHRHAVRSRKACAYVLLVPPTF